MRAPQSDDTTVELVEIFSVVKSALNRMRTRIRFVARVVGVFASLGVLVALGLTSEYQASTKLLPYRSTQNGNLSGLAGLAGIRLPTVGADQMITADLYPAVAGSLDFQMRMAETPLRFESLDTTLTARSFFAEHFERGPVDAALNFSVGLPRRVLSALLPRQLPPTVGADSNGQILAIDKKYHEMLQDLDRRIDVEIDRRTGVITLTAMLPDRYAAADLTRQLANELMAVIIDYEASKAEEQLRFVTEQQSTAKLRFESAQRSLAQFTDRNRGTLSATAQIESQRLQSEYSLAFELYRQFTNEMEQAKIRKNQDTPVFAVLEHVIVPVNRAKPKRTLIVLAWFLAGLMVSAALVLRRESPEVG